MSGALAKRRTIDPNDQGNFAVFIKIFASPALKRRLFYMTIFTMAGYQVQTRASSGRIIL
jgi:hypothetical protein